MGDINSLGSEKLQGQEKINRILEISRYRENVPKSINETQRTEYKINLYDGNSYEIVKERLGYIIKKTISESQTEYIEPMKNRKYYSSYSQALKRLNLLTKEINTLHENYEGTSLFGEDKKFILKTPNNAPEDDDEETTPAPPPPPAAPPSVPTPPLPPSPENEPPMDDEGDADATPAPPEGEGEPEDVDDDTPTPDDDVDQGTNEGDVVSFKSIQKLTGKLTQKIRDFENDKGLTSENIKYVINMILSAIDLESLSDEDKEEIMSKFDGSEDSDEDMGDVEDMGDEDENLPDESGKEDMPTPPSPEESKESYGSIFDSIFGESKVDKVISKYFQISEREKRQISEEKKQKNRLIQEANRKKMNRVRMHSLTIEQELKSESFLKKNPSFVFVGKTNKNNLVFESKNKQIKITPEGYII